MKNVLNQAPWRVGRPQRELELFCDAVGRAINQQAHSIRVTNTSGSTMLGGPAVTALGTLAGANAAPANVRFIGILLNVTPNGAVGLVAVSGMVQARFSDTPTIGECVYLSLVAGTLRGTVLPMAAGTTKYRVGICLSAADKNGLFQVRLLPDNFGVLTDGNP